MAKNSMNDWSTTPSSNTDIAGTNINVGCPPQDVGTYMRTLMAQIAYAVQGSGGTIPATWNVGQLIGPSKGTTTNDNASAGNVGEVISSTVAVGSGISLTSGTAANVTSISLTAGDWDVSGSVGFTVSAGVTGLDAAINSTSATLASSPATPWTHLSLANSTSPLGTTVLPTATGRISLASTTTVYLIAGAVFASGTTSAYGWIMARRAR